MEKKRIRILISKIIIAGILIAVFFAIRKPLQECILSEIVHADFYRYFDNSKLMLNSSKEKELELDISKTRLNTFEKDDLYYFLNALKYQLALMYKSVRVDFHDGTYLKSISGNNFIEYCRYDDNGEEKRIGLIRKNAGNYIYTASELEKYSEDIAYFTYIQDFPLKDKITNLVEIDNIQMYLEELKDTPYSVFVAIKDEGTNGLTKEDIDDLQDLGLKTDLKDKMSYSYIAIIDDGKVMYEQCKEGCISYNTVLGNNDIDLKSNAGLENGVASIKINEIDYSMNMRGLNIVVYDMENDTLIDSVNFDTWSESTCYR